MNKVTAAFALILFSATGSVAAERQWVYFDGEEPSCKSRCITTYTDTLSKKALGNGKVRISTLTDYKDYQSKQTFGLSEIETLIFDCKKSKYKSLSITWYSKYQGKGKVTDHDDSITEWGIIPDSHDKLFDKFCGKEIK